ncbi:MAG: hypothetical protein FWC39_11530 [Bacteroidetes bacterium]|nr:hypothetical protein [Bacteroidota bacterium]
MKQYKIPKETPNCVQEPAVAYETRTSNSFAKYSPKQQKEEVLTYEILQQYKREQQRLIAEGIIEKPKIVWGFTPEERAEFDCGRTVDEVFDNIAKKYGF